MFSLSNKQFMTHLTIGGICGILYFIFSHDSIFINRIINSFFMACLIPLIFGGFRLVKKLGAFHLFIYSHRKLWKYGKAQERLEEENEFIAPDSSETLGAYHEYLADREPCRSCKEPLLAGVLYLAFSLFVTIFTL